MPWKLKSSAPRAARNTNCTSVRVEGLGPSLAAMESSAIVPSCATGLLTHPPGEKVPTVYAAACGYTIAVLLEWATTSTAPWRSRMITLCPTRRGVLWLTTLGLLAAAHGGCVSQDFIHGAGQSAAAGAMQGVREGIPGLQEPLRQTLRGSLEDPAVARAAREMTDSAMQTLQARLGSLEMRQQVDLLVTQAMESLHRSGDGTVQALVKARSEEHTSELQSHHDLVCRLLLEKKKKK